MQYIGPDYDAANGIILPGLSNVLFPRSMTSGQITELLAFFPYLQPYFGTGTNDNGGGGGGGNGGNGGNGGGTIVLPTAEEMLDTWKRHFEPCLRASSHFDAKKLGEMEADRLLYIKTKK